MSFGPRQCGPNIMYSGFGGLSNSSVFTRLGVCPAVEIEGADATFGDFYTTFVNAFQQASQTGPLTEEPLMGVVR